MTKKIIRSYAIFMLLEGLAISFFFGTYSLFLVEKGLSLLEINIINASFMLATFLFEIPTGAIADFFGRKRSVVIGLLVYSFSFLVYFFSDNLWQFLLAEIIGAAAFTCISGALEALVVDSLKYHKYKGKLEFIFRRGEVRQVGILAGAIIGSFAGQVDLSWPWLMSSIAFVFLAIFSTYSFREDYFQRPNKREISLLALKRLAQGSISYGLKNKRIILAALFSASLAFIVQPLNMYWTIVFNDHFAVDVKFMGFIFSGITIFVFLGSQFSVFWQKIFQCEKKAMIFSQLITSLALISCLAFTKLPFFLSFFLIHEFGRGLLKPLIKAYVNNNIDNDNRATVLSLESMIVKAGAGLGLIFSGLIADSFGILVSWLISAAILFIAVFIFWREAKKEKY
jgi:MFS family permease